MGGISSNPHPPGRSVRQLPARPPLAMGLSSRQAPPPSSAASGSSARTYGAVAGPESAELPTDFSLRNDERLLGVARGDPKMAFKGLCCNTPLTILCALPCFWVAVPILCCVSCGEGSSAKSRALSAALILTDQALYAHNDQLALLSRVPLEEITNINLLTMDTPLKSHTEAAAYNFFQVFVRDNSIPVISFPCVKDAGAFRNKVMAAKDEQYARRMGISSPPSTSQAGVLVRQPSMEAPPSYTAATTSVTGLNSPTSSVVAPSAPPAEGSSKYETGGSQGGARAGAGAAAVAAANDSKKPAMEQLERPLVSSAFRTYVVRNDDPQDRRIVKVHSADFNVYIHEVRQKFGLAAGSPDPKIFLLRGVQVTEVDDLVPEDFVIMCSPEQRPSRETIKALTAEVHGE